MSGIYIGTRQLPATCIPNALTCMHSLWLQIGYLPCGVGHYVSKICSDTLQLVLRWKVTSYYVCCMSIYYFHTLYMLALHALIGLLLSCVCPHSIFQTFHTSSSRLGFSTWHVQGQTLYKVLSNHSIAICYNYCSCGKEENQLPKCAIS